MWGNIHFLQFNITIVEVRRDFFFFFFFSLSLYTMRWKNPNDSLIQAADLYLKLDLASSEFSSPGPGPQCLSMLQRQKS